MLWGGTAVSAETLGNFSSPLNGLSETSLLSPCPSQGGCYVVDVPGAGYVKVTEALRSEEGKQLVF